MKDVVDNGLRDTEALSGVSNPVIWCYIIILVIWSSASDVISGKTVKVQETPAYKNKWIKNTRLKFGQ